MMGELHQDIQSSFDVETVLSQLKPHEKIALLSGEIQIGDPDALAVC
jgi:hypothetical protein